MSWDIEATNEFLAWLGALSEEEQDAVDYSISLLAEEGAKLGRPYADTMCAGHGALLGGESPLEVYVTRTLS